MASRSPRQAEQRPSAAPPFGRFGHGMRGFEKPQRAANVRGTLARLWTYLGRQRASLAVVMVIVVATSGLNLLGPYLLGRAIDRCIIPRDFPALVRISGLMLGAYVLSSALTWLQSWVMVGVAQRTVREIRKDLFGALQGLPLRFFDTRPHGDLMSRVTNDVDNISQVLTDSAAGIVAGVLGLVGAAVVMLLTNVPLALVSIVSVTLLTLVVNRWLPTRIRESFRGQQSTLGALNGLIEETIGGQAVVKAYHREEATLAQFDKANAAYRQAATRAQTYAGFIGPLMNATNNLSLVVVAGTGGLLAVRGAASVGVLASFLNYARLFGRPLTDLGNLYNVIQGAIAGAERVFEVMDQAPEADAPDARPLPSLRGGVELQDVDFSYEPDVPVLQGVSLSACPGETVALIGPTGAGKTTIANLLTRFYDVDGGRILVDGQDIRTVRKDDLRRQLGVVLQDSFLFSGSVKENIRYGRLDATDEEVVAAAKLANAHSFIHRLPAGYDTQLSERGGNLSQGQRQLMAIARAILADPRILILDEATSSVDTRTEKHIQEAMRRLMAGRTSFVIAHRLSTIRAADQILVIDHGRIIERGTHAELMAQQGFYFRLCTGQFGEVEDEEEPPAQAVAAGPATGTPPTPPPTSALPSGQGRPV